ncbi:motility protein A [Desulfospira joergensenii]|uniref:motility protein A n=1 Tax=Desulfospira joergensenii TaxID=53329 RepID=UPI0003B7A20F|nr:MotA/TolQ/ExbB proton channel family protein [Desulfospira joergensenii]
MIKKIIPIAAVFILLCVLAALSQVPSIVLHLKGNLIVLAGTFACCLFSYSPGRLTNLVKQIREAFSGKTKDFKGLIREIESLSAIQRTEGIIPLDRQSVRIENRFLKAGIEMVVDGYDRYTIFKTLEQVHDNFLDARRSEADLIHTIIRLLPIFGFVGTLVGLVNVLNHMGSPEMIGKGVATALLTTFYGLIYANLIFLPMGKKLAEKTRQDSMELVLIIEGVLDIADGVNPRAVGYRLKYCMEDFYMDDAGTGRTKNPESQKFLPRPSIRFKQQDVV